MYCGGKIQGVWLQGLGVVHSFLECDRKWHNDMTCLTQL